MLQILDTGRHLGPVAMLHNHSAHGDDDVRLGVQVRDRVAAEPPRHGADDLLCKVDERELLPGLPGVAESLLTHGAGSTAERLIELVNTGTLEVAQIACCA